MDSSELLRALQVAYADTSYPAAFLERYILMECLAERRGVDTFLVQDREGAPYIAKCYDKRLWAIGGDRDVLRGLEGAGLPRQTASFESEEMYLTVRDYIPGVPLDRYAAERELTEEEIVRICAELCDILGVLHHRPEPIIHRDIKPQNVIVRPDGHLALIDFDIARVYRRGQETDTRFFGTVAYAPPEQYGFSQTDARTDIYALGVLLRWLLTGSARENKMVSVYRPLAKIIRKCTAFSPNQRFSDVDQVKKALLQANPRSRALRAGGIALCAALGAAFLVWGGVTIYRTATYTPFTDEAIPAFVSDGERVADGVRYLKDRYGTTLFDEAEDTADIGLLRRAMVELYGLDRDYVWGINEDIPQESEDYFLPWGWEDGQTVDRDVAVYAAVKAHDPTLVADWSSLKEDNGFYPGVRVAMDFAEKTGILTGMNRPGDLTVGELALVLANTDRVFAQAEEES